VTENGNAANVLLSTVRPSGQPGGGTGGGGNGGGSGGGNGGGGGTQEVRRRINLTPTAAGAAVGAKGHAEIESRADGRQKFKVEVESNRLPAGTVVEIRFTHSSQPTQTFSAGTLTLRRVFGGVEGEVEFKNHEGTPLPAGATPVSGITSVTIIRQDTGETILTGAF
jgi:hypothetical protein